MDQITYKRIQTLHPSVRKEVEQIVTLCNKALQGTAQVRITDAYRTFAQQTLLYNQGRTLPGKIVTNAKAGQSIHNYGFAVDFCLLINGKTVSWDIKKDWDNDKIADWMECVAIFKANGWDWGGDWKSFKDYPHFEKKGYSWKKLINLPKDKNGYVII